MKLKDMLDALVERTVEYSNCNELLDEEITLLSKLIETAQEQKQEILNAVYLACGSGELLVTIIQGSFKYDISSPRYEEAEFVKNRRRGPGGKFYPYIEIEFPCSVKITAIKQNKTHGTEGKVNLYNRECTVEDTVLSIPEETMDLITWHCREYSFLLE